MCPSAPPRHARPRAGASDVMGKARTARPIRRDTSLTHSVSPCYFLRENGFSCFRGKSLSQGTQHGAADMKTGATGRRRALWAVLGLLGGLEGCASNPHVKVQRMDNGLLRVEGPLAGPFAKLEALAANACELMTHEPGASNGVYGSEYCALYYYSPGEKAYFLSYLSDIKSSLNSETKSCELPRTVEDPQHPDGIVLGGVHTHPHNRRLSRRDLGITAIWNPTRFTDQSTGQVFDRNLLMFFREKTGECRAYTYNNFSRLVSALREGVWVPIAQVTNDSGDLEMFAGKDWLP